MSCKCNAKPFTVNAEVGGKGKLITHNGASVLSVPVVAIVEGVLNGAYVSTAEFGKFASAWEGIPVPINHPQINGENVSANLPSVIESSVVGRYHNVQVVGNKLAGDMYINGADAKSKGFEAVYNDLASGKTIEVSTAYFCDAVEHAGLFNGVPYTHIHTNLRPDHLALLPNDTGACSVADGCGTFMANAWSKVRSLFVGNQDESHETVRDLISTAIRAGLAQTDAYPYILETFDTSVVYELAGQLYQRDYTTADGVVTLGSPVPVRVEKSYVPMETKTETEEVEAMAEMTPEQLTAVNWATDQYNKKQTALVAEIVANAANKFTPAQLQVMHNDQLQSLADTLRPADYSGRGSAVVVTNADEAPEALPAAGYAF